jgi:hypothetical protein
MEPAKKAEAAEKPKRHVKWGQFSEGACSVAFALACGGVDIYNNAAFGMEKNGAIAAMFVVAGFGLVYLPGTVKNRLDIQALGLVVVCAAMTLFAGYQNHMASQKNHTLADAAVTERYNAAQTAIKAANDDYTKAKAEFEGIAETSGYDELKIAYDAAIKLYEDNKDSCGPICKDARDQIKLLPDRMGKAKAKADAHVRVTEALARMASEKGKAPKQAKAAGVSEREEEVMAILLLLLSVVGATMAHRGYRQMTSAFTDAPAPKVKREPAKKVAAATEMGQREKLEKCLDTCTSEAPDGPLVGSDKFRQMVHDYWRAHHPSEPVPSQRAIGGMMGKEYKNYRKGKDTKTGNIGYFAKIDYKLSLVGKVA